jgi:lipopolysaccharide export system protein LptA
VRVQQGDSTNIYGQFLKYNGNTRMAEIQKSVRYSSGSTTLTTELLFYDMKASQANYPNGGTIVNKENTLTSQVGYFNPKKKSYSFKKNVVLTNPKYVITCDTLNYSSAVNTAYFLGPTQIKGSNVFIYCESGWYSTDKDVGMFRKNAYIVSKDQTMKGDSIYFEKADDFGKAMGNVSIIDTTQHIIVGGDLAIRSGKTETATVTGHALLKQYYSEDTLFLHADTLRAVDEHPTKKVLVEQVITTKKDKKKTLQTYVDEKDTSVTWRKLYAYHKVKFFKEDMQGSCDSLIYSSKDSLMHLFINPVLWSEQNQLTAKKMDLMITNGEIKTMFLNKDAFIISKEDTVKYNQIKGKQMTGYFKKNELRKILVEGNGQTIYFAKDKEKLIGVNKAECSNLMIYIKENQVDKITFLKKPEATLFPMKEFTPDEFKLKDFVWRENERPLSVEDIFK